MLLSCHRLLRAVPPCESLLWAAEEVLAGTLLSFLCACWTLPPQTNVLMHVEFSIGDGQKRLRRAADSGAIVFSASL